MRGTCCVVLPGNEKFCLQYCLIGSPLWTRFVIGQSFVTWRVAVCTCNSSISLQGITKSTYFYPQIIVSPLPSTLVFRDCYLQSLFEVPNLRQVSLCLTVSFKTSVPSASGTCLSNRQDLEWKVIIVDPTDPCYVVALRSLSALLHGLVCTWHHSFLSLLFSWSQDSYWSSRHDGLSLERGRGKKQRPPLPAFFLRKAEVIPASALLGQDWVSWMLWIQGRRWEWGFHCSWLWGTELRERVVRMTCGVYPRRAQGQ